jgi:hypothetical protein
MSNVPEVAAKCACKVSTIPSIPSLKTRYFVALYGKLTMTPCGTVFKSRFRRNLSGTLRKTVHHETRIWDASGAYDVSMVIGTPSEKPTARM